MEKKHQETLLQTIKCHLERNKQGDIKLMPDPSGKFNVVVINKPPVSGLVRYFEPAYTFGVDEYGVPYP